jgi:hypothetical protein
MNTRNRPPAGPPGGDGADAPPLRERRSEPREAANTPARLFYGPGYAHWTDCVVKDRSTSGAKVQVAAIFELPARLVLLDYREGVAFVAQRRWRKGDLVGLWLEVRHDLRDLKDPGLQEVREAWLKLGPGLGGAEPG